MYSVIAERKLQGLFLSERHGEQLRRSILDEHPTDGLRVNETGSSEGGRKPPTQEDRVYAKQVHSYSSHRKRHRDSPENRLGGRGARLSPPSGSRVKYHKYIESQ